MNIPWDKNRILNKHFDLTGRVFKHLTVIEFAGFRRYGNKRKDAREWLCQCVCGNSTRATTEELRGKRRTSCGCRGKKSLKTMPEISLESLTKQRYRFKLLGFYTNAGEEGYSFWVEVDFKANTVRYCVTKPQQDHSDDDAPYFAQLNEAVLYANELIKEKI